MPSSIMCEAAANLMASSELSNPTTSTSSRIACESSHRWDSTTQEEYSELASCR